METPTIIELGIFSELYAGKPVTKRYPEFLLAKVLEKKKKMDFTKIDITMEDTFFAKDESYKGVIRHSLSGGVLAIEYVDGYEDSADLLAELYVHCREKKW